LKSKQNQKFVVVEMQDNNGDLTRPRKRRWGEAPVNDKPLEKAAEVAPTTASAGLSDPKAKALALKESIAARLAALKQAKANVQNPNLSSASSLTNAKDTYVEDAAPSSKKARKFDLDLTITGPTFQPQLPIRTIKPANNPYLAHLQKEHSDTVASKSTSSIPSESSIVVQKPETDLQSQDPRLIRSSKPRHRHKEWSFVEPGTFVALGQKQRTKAAQVWESGYASGRKMGNKVVALGLADTYGPGGAAELNGGDDDDPMSLVPRPDCRPLNYEMGQSSTGNNSDFRMPLIMEWWDVELLPATLRKQVQALEGQALVQSSKRQLKSFRKIQNSSVDGVQTDATATDKESSELGLTTSEIATLTESCWSQAALSHSKTAALVQHIVPLVSKSEKTTAVPLPTVFLTKRELKRQRKLRRAEQLRQKQDMQAVGLLPPPEPKLTLSNFMRVLGDQATLDPSQMERKVLEQMQARQKAHLDRNAERKLTPEQRAAKLARKLFEDTSKGVTVALFYVKNLSHTYHRTKVDLNAQQNNITGGVLECGNPSLACVICEGGPKAIKRYTRLMLVRMKWQGPDDAEEDDANNEPLEPGAVKQVFTPDNKCELVWTGMSKKRLFKGFQFQSCDNSDTARKVFANKGIEHYWDQVIAHSLGRGEQFHLKLGNEESDDDENDEEQMGDAE
jgi:U4/U6 small nuclear ribonucleoprotein PRP3